jgi:hypothetical protein
MKVLGAGISVVLVCVGLWLVPGGDGAAEPAGAAEQAQAARAPTRAPLASVGAPGSEGVFFARVDPLTLAPREPKWDLREYHDSYSFSPDGSQIAFGKGGPDLGVSVMIVDAARFELVGGVQTGIAVEALAWLAPRRLVGMHQGGAVFAADPATGAILRRTTVTGVGCDVTHPPAFATRRALVLLMGRVVVTVGKNGRMRRAVLRGLPDGCHGAGLALDRAGDRAFVVGADARVGVVNLRTMKVSRRVVRGPGRLRGAASTAAVWLGRGRLAVAHLTRRDRAAGVELIDLRRGVRRWLSARAGGVSVGGGRLLVFDGGFAGTGPRSGMGLRGFNRTGTRERFHVLRGQRVWTAQVAGHFAYALTDTMVAVVDLRTGRVVHRSPDPPDEFELLRRGGR